MNRHVDIQVLSSQPPRPNPNCYWVTNSLLAGEYPIDEMDEAKSREKIRGYLRRGVNFFVDLTQEDENEPYQQMLEDEASMMNTPVDYRRIPVEDFGIPSHDEMKRILDVIDEAILSDNKTVYLHCRGGIGRTGTAVGCYLARHGYSGEEALSTVNALFQNSDRSYDSSCSPETHAQKKMVKMWKG